MNSGALEATLERLRASLKRRGAEGIRGLARHFKICDTKPKNGRLDREEFAKCCRLNKLGLEPQEVDVLFTTFDADRSGEIGYEEFLRALRGRLSPPRRQLVTRVFEVLDRMGGGKGYLTVDSIKDVYSTSKHPKVLNGQMSKQEALQDFLNGFEGAKGNRDGMIELHEFIDYYEEVSMSIDSDDYFGQMMVATWSHLKKKGPGDTRTPAITYVASADVERLQAALKRSIYEKSTSPNQRKVLEAAFKKMDRDGSGSVTLPEFVDALERFGMQVVGEKDLVNGLPKVVGGWPRDVVAALFSRFDEDGSGSLTYGEFAARLYEGEEEPLPPQATFDPLRPLTGPRRDAQTGKLIGKKCFEGNEWLKGSNGIFEMNYRTNYAGNAGGGASGRGQRPTSSRY